MTATLAVVLAYLLGSIPFGYLLVWWKKRIDVRSLGSRSTGATNVMRALGLAGFVATFLLDALKGSAAVLASSRLTDHNPIWISAAAFASLAGHCYPVWLGFRGGKGVATAVGVFMTLAPAPMAAALVIFALLVAVWRYISLGSIAATVAFPALFYLLERPPAALLAGATACALLIVARHRANISRLLRGTENRVGAKKTAAPAG